MIAFCASEIFSPLERLLCSRALPWKQKISACYEPLVDDVLLVIIDVDFMKMRNDDSMKPAIINESLYHSKLAWRAFLIALVTSLSSSQASIEYK